MAPLDLQGQLSPSVIVYCTCSVENVFSIMHLIVWATVGHDARRYDDQATLFFKIVFDSYWKDEWKLEPAVVSDLCALILLTEYLTWIGLTMMFGLKSYTDDAGFLNTDDACTLLEYLKVLSCGKWSRNCTVSLWKRTLKRCAGNACLKVSRSKV